MSHAEECPSCGGLFEDRQKYRDIRIRAKTCNCDTAPTSEETPTFRHWNKRVTPGIDPLSDRYIRRTT